jgi:hypothetical protein
MTMKIHPLLTTSAYLVAITLMLYPILDTVLAAWPLRPGETTWRFGVTGLLSRTLMTSSLGLLLTMVIALVAGHRVALRAAAVVSAVAAVTLLVLSGLFMLDAVQTRANVNPQAKTAFDVASAVALIKTVLGAALAAGLAVGGWRSHLVRGQQAAPAAGRRQATPLIVAAPE